MKTRPAPYAGLLRGPSLLDAMAAPSDPAPSAPRVEPGALAEVPLATRPARPAGPKPARLASASLPAAVLDRLRDVVFFSGAGLTLAELLGEAAEREIRRRELERGSPFPRRGEARIRTGRPIGSGGER